MIRRCLIALMVAVIGFTSSGALGTGHTLADNIIPATITNITVYVDGSGNAIYRVCAMATNLPLRGGVAVAPAGDPNNLQRATWVANGACGGGSTYMLVATFSGLPAGQYKFDSACVQANDFSIDCKPRQGVFASGTNQTIESGCQIDFDLNTGLPNAPSNCTIAGTQGDITTNGPTPTPTYTPTSTPTNTATPTNTPVPTNTPTNTPTPIFVCCFVTDTPTNTPIPSATTGSNPPTSTPTTGSGNGGNPPTSTPTNTVAPTVQITSGNPTNTPTSNNPNPSPTQTSPPVEVGNNPTPTTPINPPQNPGPSTSTGTSTNSAGLSNTQHKGPVLRVTLERSLLRPGETMRLRVSYAANALVRANANVTVVTRQRVTHTVHQTVNGKTVTKKVTKLVSRNVARQLSAVDATDSHGRVTLSIQVPSNIVLTNGHATVKVSVRAMVGTWHAETTSRLSISDMLLSLAGGRIKNCLQSQTVNVSYHPNTSLSIVLQFPNGHKVTLTAHANAQGKASAQVQLKYVNANSALRIGVQATDAHAHRTERNTFTVSVPQACQKQAPSATITVGS